MNISDISQLHLLLKYLFSASGGLVASRILLLETSNVVVVVDLEVVVDPALLVETTPATWKAGKQQDTAYLDCSQKLS